ncbi:MAG: amidohydrolase [Polyangiaceae bacterium]|nr:amidohydrolase [Polyangiaceae bacterium]
MSKAIALGIGLFAAGCASAPAAAPKSGTAADFVIVGASIRTMDPGKPRAEALAVAGDRIVAVGTEAEVSAFVGPNTRTVRLAGSAIVPGLVDGHCHLHGLGVAQESLDVRGKKSPEEVARSVADAAKGRPSGEWITGRGWDQNLFTPAVFPTHVPLDAAVPDRPVVLTRIDGHALWANQAAMRAAGIDQKAVDPPGGRIMRDEKGEPTGVFIDNAMDLVQNKMPAESQDARERRILRAADTALSLGLSGVHEMGIDDATIAAYRKLAAEGRLPIRVYGYLAGDAQLGLLSGRKPDQDESGTAMFVLRGVKLFADGALGSRGASLLQPYEDEPSSSGLSIMNGEALGRAAKVAADAGFQLAVHAIGDKANREVLDAFSSIGEGRAKALRFRVEHAQVVSPEDMGRFAQIGVIASMQPTHATSDMPWAPARLGPDRLAGAYAWRSLEKAGAFLVFGSDFPVEEPSPLLGIWAAVSRQDPAGNPPGGFLPEQRVTLDEAIAGFTTGPAYAAFAENSRGKIAPGYVADLTVFEKELTAGRELLDTKIVAVVVGGKQVYGHLR